MSVPTTPDAGSPHATIAHTKRPATHSEPISVFITSSLCASHYRPVKRRATSKEEQSRSFVIIRVYGRWRKEQNGPTGLQPPMADEPHPITRFPRQRAPGAQLDSW